MKEEPIITTYVPIIVNDEFMSFPVMKMTGKSDKKYLIIPDEYLDIEQHILLNGVTLIPIKNDFIN